MLVEQSSQKTFRHLLPGVIRHANWGHGTSSANTDAPTAEFVKSGDRRLGRKKSSTLAVAVAGALALEFVHR